MATASFRTDSPKTSEYILGSTLSEWKIARTVTGSVALGRQRVGECRSVPMQGGVRESSRERSEGSLT